MSSVRKGRGRGSMSGGVEDQETKRAFLYVSSRMQNEGARFHSVSRESGRVHVFPNNQET